MVLLQPARGLHVEAVLCLQVHQPARGIVGHHPGKLVPYLVCHRPIQILNDVTTDVSIYPGGGGTHSVEKGAGPECDRSAPSWDQIQCASSRLFLEGWEGCWQSDKTDSVPTQKRRRRRRRTERRTPNFRFLPINSGFSPTFRRDLVYQRKGKGNNFSRNTLLFLVQVVGERKMASAFEEFGVLPELIKAVSELGWSLPTDIQAEAIPLILGGGDVMAVRPPLQKKIINNK